MVDGQQRMTTAVIFIAKALALYDARKIALGEENPELLRRVFVCDELAGGQKLHTIQEDEPFFQSQILGISSANCLVDSSSSRRLRNAADHFAKNVVTGEWEALIHALRTAKVMVYAVGSPQDATQIFELQNDRGKPLTDLEALKSFLMHCVYLHSANNADDRLAALQTQFSKIYRTVEGLTEESRAPDEDQVLTYHCAAFLSWTKREDYSNPKRLVKATVKAMEGAKAISWIERFVSSLLESYKAIKDLFARRDELSEFSELLILGHMASFWPLALKAWMHDGADCKGDFRKTCRLLEVFAFRGYAMANLRGDTNLSRLHAEGRDFTGNFQPLFARLSDMNAGHNLEARFVAGLDYPYLYETEGRGALYLLWRYENHLREQRGRIQPLLSWRDFVEPRSYAAKFSVEHVAAKENQIANTTVVWEKEKGEAKLFREVALHRLGNLVIDSISPNASKGKGDFSDKLKSLSEDSIYLSQGELVRFVRDRDHATWDAESVRSRHNHLIEFALRAWDPETYHAVKHMGAP